MHHDKFHTQYDINNYAESDTWCRFLYLYHTPKSITQKSSYPKITALTWWTMTESNCRHPACKAGALPAELIVHVVTRPGIEPGIPP